MARERARVKRVTTLQLFRKVNKAEQAKTQVPLAAGGKRSKKEHGRERERADTCIALCYCCWERKNTNNIVTESEWEMGELWLAQHAGLREQKTRALHWNWTLDSCLWNGVWTLDWHSQCECSHCCFCGCCFVVVAFTDLLMFACLMYTGIHTHTCMHILWCYCCCVV